ncbi:MAG: aspartate aminotransferase family protein [Planctomycetota bacterium]|nr:MAG: aspartate aminotransferase family protein [Planctomycetota bacterium]
MQRYRQNDHPWREGRIFGYIFDVDEEVREVIRQAYTSFLTENALDPTVFPSLLEMEREVVAIAASHLQGDGEVVGNFTSGGTESIFLAVKAARDKFREENPHLTQIQMILPVTAHAAFHKAAHYLDVEAIVVPVDPRTFKADVEAMKDAITESTFLLVASAPSYSHGVIDPIEEIGQLALENNIYFHVDACIGGFLLPFWRKLGRDIPSFDFSVEGVSSISMDFHKYAYAAKGASVVLYRDKGLRKYQIFTCSHWTGYAMVNPTVQSSKSGGPLASCWALLNYLGEEGYLELSRKTLVATEKISQGIERIGGLYILGEPEMSLLAVASDEVNVFHIIDEMRARGWYIQPQFARGGGKENFHLSITAAHFSLVDPFLEDLEESVESARRLPPPEEVDLGELKVEDLDEVSMGAFLEMVGIREGRLPSRMAGIHQMLNSSSPELVEAFLRYFSNELYSL